MRRDSGHINVNPVVQQRINIQDFPCGVCVEVIVLGVVVPCNPVGENWRLEHVVHVAVIYKMISGPKIIHFDHEEGGSVFLRLVVINH